MVKSKRVTVNVDISNLDSVIIGYAESERHSIRLECRILIEEALTARGVDVGALNSAVPTLTPTATPSKTPTASSGINDPIPKTFIGGEFSENEVRQAIALLRSR